MHINPLTKLTSPWLSPSRVRTDRPAKIGSVGGDPIVVLNCLEKREPNQNSGGRVSI